MISDFKYLPTPAGLVGFWCVAAIPAGAGVVTPVAASVAVAVAATVVVAAIAVAVAAGLFAAESSEIDEA